MRPQPTNDWLANLRAELADHQRQVGEGKTCEGYVWLTLRRLVERIDALEANAAMRDDFRQLGVQERG